MLQASSTLDSKNHDDSFFFHPNKIPVFTVNVMNRNSILRDLCTSYRLFPPLSLSSSPSSFHFAVQQTFTRKGFIGNPCLGIYSGFCHKLWQHRNSLLIYNSKYFNKVITIKSSALFSWSRDCERAAALPDMSETNVIQRLPLRRRQGFWKGRQSFPPKNTMLK